jgi:hypothetical protein
MPTIQRPIDWEGALVDLRIGVPVARPNNLTRLKMPVPAPVQVLAQVDTGTHRSGVDGRVLRQLGPDGPVDIENVFTSSTGEGPHPCPVYLADLTLLSVGGNLHFGTVRVLAHTFGAPEQARATIGRDLLKRCALEYVGTEDYFRLSF